MHYTALLLSERQFHDLDLDIAMGVSGIEGEREKHSTQLLN